MASVRLGEDLEQRLRAVARLLGVSESEVIREAVAAHCASVLGERLAARLDDYVGAMGLGGGWARHTGKRFTALLTEKKRGARR